ncbi:MAG: hypothetical protein ABIU95_12845 [Burkholderiales bacterium]
MTTEQQEIRCPHCEWKPAAESRWSCAPGCGTVWNTFWTRGLCPGCTKRWTDTQCPECNVISPHRKWYRIPERTTTRTRRAKTPTPTT